MRDFLLERQSLLAPTLVLEQDRAVVSAVMEPAASVAGSPPIVVRMAVARSLVGQIDLSATPSAWLKTIGGWTKVDKTKAYVDTAMNLPGNGAFNGRTPCGRAPQD